MIRNIYFPRYYFPFLDCTTASSASGGGGLRPTLSPVSAPWSRGSSGVVTWRWPYRWAWSTPSTASFESGYAYVYVYVNLEFHRVVAYLRGVVRAFLRYRSIAYIVRGGGMTERAIWCWVRCCGISCTTWCFGRRCLRNRH